MQGWMNTEEPAQLSPFPTGQHTGKVTKIMLADKNGNMLTSKRGEPQLYIVMSDGHSHEALYTVTVTDKKLVFPERSLGKFLKAAGFNFEAMQAGGVTTPHFLDPHFLAKVFFGKTLAEDFSGTFIDGDSFDKCRKSVTFIVKPPRQGKDDKAYTDIELVIPGEAKPTTPPPAPQPNHTPPPAQTQADALKADEEDAF